MSGVKGVDPLDCWSAAWSAALDDLELELERAEAMLASQSVPPADITRAWTPPALPPIPPDMVERARMIHQRQLDMAGRMTARLGDLGRHAIVAQRMRPQQAPSRPVLFDQAC